MTPQRRYRAEIEAVARLYGVSLDAVLGRSRALATVEARNAAMWALRETHGLSFPHIGRMFGRCHAAVIFGVGAHWLRVDPTHKLAVATARIRDTNREWRRANPTRQGRRA